MNTFDSGPRHYALAHDVDFQNFIKAKSKRCWSICLGPGLPPTLMGNTCESVLPHELGNWTGCPDCSRGDEELTDGADPCFGGYLVVSTSSHTAARQQAKKVNHPCGARHN